MSHPKSEPTRRRDFFFCVGQREEKMHYYQHHIGDFIKATARLTDSQTMAYLRLLWMYYDTEKPLKPDSRLLAFQIGATIEETELLLESFFWLADNGWHHTRCDQEISEYREFLEKKSNAGRASAERRKHNSATGAEQVLNNSSTDVQLTNNQQPITNNQRKNKAVVTAAPDGVSQEVWESFLQQRKASRAVVTPTVVKKIAQEAQKAGWTLENALAECSARGWRGFKAEWVAEKQQKNVGERNRDTMQGLTRGLIGGGNNVQLLK
jgi:uncharacterized protein YdaU (DUF1376 family)